MLSVRHGGFNQRRLAVISVQG
jgi:hypothetical protein